VQVATSISNEMWVRFTLICIVRGSSAFLLQREQAHGRGEGWGSHYGIMGIFARCHRHVSLHLLSLFNFDMQPEGPGMLLNGSCIYLTSVLNVILYRKSFFWAFFRSLIEFGLWQVPLLSVVSSARNDA